MDIYRIDSDLKFLNQIGLTLEIEEKEKSKIATGFRQISCYFGEKSLVFSCEVYDNFLLGTEQDYYIAIGLQFKNSYEFPQKQLFWRLKQFSNNFEFQELPMINEEYKGQIEGFNSQFFSGKHDKIVIQVKDEEEEEQDNQANESVEGGEQEDKIPDTDSEKNIIVQIQKNNKFFKVKPKNFKELDRLAYVVRTIETQSATVPIGAFKLTPSHELRFNDQFEGLSIMDANNLENYQHFRNVQQSNKREKLDKADCIQSYDFLDAIIEDKPIGCWSLQSDTSKKFVTVRSLLWPGYVAYHQANANIFGGVYFGEGIRNSDLAFQL